MRNNSFAKCEKWNQAHSFRRGAAIGFLASYILQPKGQLLRFLWCVLMKKWGGVLQNGKSFVTLHPLKNWKGVWYTYSRDTIRKTYRPLAEAAEPALPCPRHSPCERRCGAKTKAGNHNTYSIYTRSCSREATQCAQVSWLCPPNGQGRTKTENNLKQNNNSIEEIKIL